MENDNMVRVINSRHRFFALVILLPLLSSGCKVSFLQPATSTEVVDAAPFLAVWEVTEIFGSPPGKTSQLELRPGDGGDLAMIFSEGAGSEETTGRLASAGDLTLLSVRNKDGSFHIVNLVLEDGGQRLVVRLPDPSILAAAVSAQQLAGEVVALDRDENLVDIQADGEDLAAFFAANPSIFNDAFSVLAKNVS